MSRIVQLANFVTPTSGGLRTALSHLSSGYAAAGHEVVQVLPGPVDATTTLPWGRQVQLRAPELPGTGYRVLPDPRRVTAVLTSLGPDRVEVHSDPVALVGYEGRARPALAELVIRRQHIGRASNDIGFLRTETGYQAIVSDYDQARHGAAWLAALHGRYEHHARRKHERLAAEERRKLEEERRRLVEAQRQAIHERARQMGYRVEEAREGDRLRLVLMKRVY